MAGLAETIGVEEEFHLLDASGQLASAAKQVLSKDDDLEAELMSSAVETASAIHTSLEELRDGLYASRAAVVAAGEKAGVRVVTAGSVPSELPANADPFPKERYVDMVADYGEVGRQQVVCAAQWHVGVPSRDEAVALAGSVRRWLPVLLALSASSPYFDGRDTGYASYRSVIWSRWPTAGVYGTFADAAEYDAIIAALISSGVASDPGMVYFDARPSANYPTLEIRVADACPRVEDVVTLAGLVQALVVTVSREPEPDARVELLRAATWTAARRGLADTLLDPLTWQPVPAADAVARLLERVTPALTELGTHDVVSAGLEDILATGGSAARQRAVVEAGGSLPDVTDLLVSETKIKPPLA